MSKLKEWLLSLNCLAKDIYREEWRISTTLNKRQFDDGQIAFLKSDGLECFLCNIDSALQWRFSHMKDTRFTQIIYHRYGLFGCEGKTLRTIGKEMSISPERVRQLQVKALKRIKPIFESLIVISACCTLKIEPETLLYAISIEQLSPALYSEAPISISTFSSKLNKMLLKPAGMNRISHMKISNWLLDQGYLENVPYPNKSGNIKVPTEKGKSIGIFWGQKQQSDGQDSTSNYMVALYNIDAQRFIVEHLDKIFDRMPQTQRFVVEHLNEIVNHMHEESEKP